VSHLSHTQQVEAREHFEQLAALPPSEIPLAEMALWIAAESRPEVDVDYWLGELAALAERIRPHCAVATSDVDRVDILNRVLFLTEGFAGNTENYSDPLNSFLDAVLETRKGIPITLAIIYLDVAQKVGLLSAGVGFPGHFLVKVYADSRELIVDPFFGKLLSPTECGDRLKQVIGKHVDLKPKMLKTVSTIEILQRVLRNLKLLHVSRKEYEEALACSERILLLSGDDPMELRDRGLIYRELGCAGPALADLELYLAHAPSDPQSLPLTEILRDLRVRARRVH
jgi:regulator of sirC expression with transglutaminase-like and TPR domain